MAIKERLKVVSPMTSNDVLMLSKEDLQISEEVCISYDSLKNVKSHMYIASNKFDSILIDVEDGLDHAYAKYLISSLSKNGMVYVNIKKNQLSKEDIIFIKELYPELNSSITKCLACGKNIKEVIPIYE